MPKIGAHVSAATSMDLAFKRAKEINADCFQIFISPPRRWIEYYHPNKVIEKFKKAQVESGIGPNFIHATYLLSLGASTPNHIRKTINWLIYALNVASSLNMTGVIMHSGSTGSKTFKDTLPQITNTLKAVLESTNVIPSKPSERRNLNSNTPFLILETAAGAGNVIGNSFRELGQILKAVDDPRLKICLDTQHAFSSGYTLHTPAGLDKVLEEFDREIGLENLVVIHANDSKTPLASKRDRHENIGEGKIGLQAFRSMVNHPKLKDIPFILEVPGFDRKKGPDLKNVEILKSLTVRDDQQ